MKDSLTSNFTITLAGIAALAIPQVASAQAPPTFTVTDLGTLGGPTANGLGINDSGEVAGGADTATARHAGLWNGAWVDLHGALAEPNSEAFEVNNAGDVVGYSLGSQFRAKLWQGGNIIDLGTLGGPGSSAYGINNFGWVVGDADTTPGGTPHAFAWRNGVMVDLGTLGGSNSLAWAINDRGLICGRSFLATPGEHAFLWRHGTMIDLGTLGGENSDARAINKFGDVVGWAQLPSFDFHAFIRVNSDAPQMVDIGTLPGGNFSIALGINTDRQVVGDSNTSVGIGQHAFYWDPASGMHDLNSLIPDDSGWELLRANGINNHGQITGYGIHAGMPFKAFLLTPQ